jgi:SAM-dependent methyltransferase
MTASPHAIGSRSSSGEDLATLAAYDRDAASFAEDWSAQPTPADMYDIVRRFFSPGPTADIGCGAGRDTAWLDANGFPCIGFDASAGLLAEARRRHPELQFQQAFLPALQGLADHSFCNVLCETVIMHLEPSAISEAVGRMLSILMPGGTLYLSWRLTIGDAMRDAHGRLYAAFNPDLVVTALGSAEILLDEQPISASSGKAIRRVVARKPAE